MKESEANYQLGRFSNGLLRDKIVPLSLCAGFLIFLAGYGIPTAIEGKRRALELAGLLASIICFVVALGLGYWAILDDGPWSFLDAFTRIRHYLLG